YEHPGALPATALRLERVETGEVDGRAAYRRAGERVAGALLGLRVVIERLVRIRRWVGHEERGAPVAGHEGGVARRGVGREAGARGRGLAAGLEPRQGRAAARRSYRVA